MRTTIGGLRRAGMAVALTLACFHTQARAQTLVREARAAVEATRPDSTERLEALLAESRALQSYDLRQALERAEESERLATRLGDDTQRARALAMQARTLVDLEGPKRAREKIEAARAALAADAPAAAEAEVLLAGALLHFTLDEPTECLRDVRQAIALAEQADAFGVLMRANLVAMSIVGLGNDRTGEIAAIAELARKSGNQGLMLEARVLTTLAADVTGAEQGVIAKLEELLAEARELGDRLREGFVLRMLAARHAATDLTLAATRGREAYEAFRRHGGREYAAMTLDYLARVAIADDRIEDACDLSKQAVEGLQGMGMKQSLHDVMETASQAATLAGRGEEARAFREGVIELERELATRFNADRAALWRDTAELGRDIEEMKHSYKAQLHDMDVRLQTVLLVGGGVLLLLTAATSLLLLRAKRRTDAANARLQEEIAAAAAAQAERRAIEANMHQLERLDSIGMLAGGFAHDFNNILVGIRGNAQLALHGGAFDGEPRELVEQIISSSDRAAGLCKDILAYAHSGSTPRMQIDLREVLEGVLPLARSGFGGGIELEVALGARPCPVYVDRAQIEQVFLNILVNAADAMDKRGRIRVNVHRQHLPGEPPTGHWFGEFTGDARDCFAVTITDSGQGMSEETIRRIFDPFFSTRFPGRGLGLAATYGILRRHKGVVNVESQPGRGSTFTVFLPCSSEADLQTPEPVVTLEPQRHKKRAPEGELLLVVDDDLQVRRVVERALENDGYQVVTADGSAAALQLAEQYGERIRLAVIDYTMPEMDGAELCMHLQQRLPDLRALLVSGQSEQIVRSAAPHCALLAKPFDTRSLVEAVRALHARV